MRGLFLVAALALTSCGKSTATPPPPVHWYDLKTGEVLAQHEHKPILVFCFATWSTADVMLDRETFASTAVRGEMQDFIAIRVDLTNDDDPEARRNAERFKVVGVPSLLAIRSLNDYPSSGSYDQDRHALFHFNEFMTAEQLVPKLQDAKRRFREGL